MRRAAVLLLFLLPLAACSLQEQPVRTLVAVTPAAGISAVALGVNIGAVTIMPSKDAEVHVSVGLRPSNSFLGVFSMGGEHAIKAAVINQASADGVLKLSMRYPANTDASGVNEYWTVAVPAGMHVSSDINVGKLRISGISGGVEANLNVGKVTLDLPSGPMKVSVNVGKINAQAHTLNYGKVSVSADVGDYSLEVNGVSTGNQEKTSPGNHRLSYQGHGQDAISLTVSTGKVTLALSGK